MEESQPQTGHGPAAVAPTPTPTPKDKDGIIHLQVQQNQVHMNAPPQTQTQPQDNVDINAASSSSCVPVEIPKGPTTESAEPSVEDMDLLDDSLVLVTKHAVSAEIGNGSGPDAALVHASRTSPTIGGKRTPTESTEPSVTIVYNNLTRESKRALMELMQQWSEWQATKQPDSTESAEQVLDCGEETYYPAIHVGSERPCAVSFWVDNNQARENAAVDVDDGAVPLYDREFTLGDSSNAESKKEDKKDDWRCLNCASSSHALKDCPKPHDHVAISMAREQVKLKRKISKVIRQQNRPLKRRYL